MLRAKGFTLLEVMLVMVIIGFMLTALIPNIRGADIEDEVQQHSERFAAVFTLASEYSLLNNVEMGLYVKDNSYQFLGFDGVRWREIPDKEVFSTQQFEIPFTINLSLDELELDDQFVVKKSMFEDDDTEDSFEEEDELIYPEVFILSGGDISPFTLTFTHDDGFELPISFAVSGTYSVPLSIEGPFADAK